MKKKILTSLALCAVLLGFQSCKKDNDGPVEPANFSVVHASPGSAGIELYLDDVKATTSPVSFGTASDYSSIAAKQYNLKIANVNTINPLAETGVNFGGGRNYSIFAYDTLVNNSIKVFVTEDDLTAPAAGEAKIRFFHLAPEEVNVDIVANNTVLFSNRSYADNISNASLGNFMSVDAGTYDVDVRLAGSGPSIPSILTVPGVVVQAGKIYTIIAKGRVNGTGETALSAQLIENN